VTDPAPSGQPDPGNGGDNNSGWTPPATQQELNRIISERVQRERAKFADYEDLKAAAGQVGTLTERLAAVEAEKADVPSVVAQQLRAHLVELHGIEKDDADLFLTATEPETLLKQVNRLTARTSKQGLHVAREGATPTPPGEDQLRSFTRGLFQRSDP
jgi:hypothetical protein